MIAKNSTRNLINVLQCSRTSGYIPHRSTTEIAAASKEATLTTTPSVNRPQDGRTRLSVPASAKPTFDLDQPVLRFAETDDAWSLRHACENAQIFGRIGSGKTSGSGLHIAKSFLRSGFGGLVLTAKPDELAFWVDLCRRTGRLNSLIVVDADGKAAFNFMDYELRRGGAGAGNISNIAKLLTQIAELDRPSGQGGANEQFWQSNLERLIANALQVSVAVDGKASLDRIEELIRSSPKTRQEAEDPQWCAGSALYQALDRLDGMTETLPESDYFDSRRAVDYWLHEFPGMDERTRSNIIATFEAVADNFLRGDTRRLFCTTTTIVPEMTHLGHIIIVNLPTAEHGPFGRMAQVLLKYVWQRATLRRIGKVNHNTRPVFLWADESQEFVTSADADFLNQGRAALACVVYLTQSLPNYHAKIGKAATDSLLGSFNTKFFHSLACAETAQYAAELIARDRRYTIGYSEGASSGLEIAQPNINYSESMDYQLHSRDFYNLRSGGPANDSNVDAVIVQGGRVWRPSGKNFLHWSMRQTIR
jgi:hypothetical protein